MISRRQWQLAALTTASALFLAACGGGSGISGAVDAPVAKRVIVFGDSLSDLGTYTPATQIPLGQAPGVPPFFGGRFTTNTFTGYSATSNTSTAPAKAHNRWRVALRASRWRSQNLMTSG